MDKFSVEMQNPEITSPRAPVMCPGQLQNDRSPRREAGRPAAHGTGQLRAKARPQGLGSHPRTHSSGVPYVGFAREGILSGQMRRVMIVGKGSLFLGRLTNLFDGISFLLEANPGKEGARTVEPEEVVTVGVTLLGSEHGLEEVLKGAELAQKRSRGLRVVAIGPKCETSLTVMEANTEDEQHKVMQELLTTGQIDACVTMHYNFPWA